MNLSLNVFEANPLLLVALAALLLAQALFIFYDARRIGSSHYWLWGLFGLLNVPSSLIIYLLVTRVFGRKK